MNGLPSLSPQFIKRITKLLHKISAVSRFYHAAQNSLRPTKYYDDKNMLCDEQFGFKCGNRMLKSMSI